MAFCKERGHLALWKGFGLWSRFSAGGERRCATHEHDETAERRSMNLENIMMLLVSLFLMVYLIYALLRPEKF